LFTGDVNIFEIEEEMYTSVISENRWALDRMEIFNGNKVALGR
jgi:hypothetical protein